MHSLDWTGEVTPTDRRQNIFVTVAEPHLNILFYFILHKYCCSRPSTSHAAVRLTWRCLHTDGALLAGEDQPPPGLPLVVPHTPPLPPLSLLPAAGDAEHAGLAGVFTQAVVQGDGLHVVGGENDQSSS